MHVAVAILLFVLAVCWFLAAIWGEIPISGGLFAAANVALGVLNMTWPAIHLAVGVVLCVEALVVLIFSVFMIKEASGGTERAFQLLGALGLLLFAWATVFGILQFVLVV